MADDKYECRFYLPLATQLSQYIGWAMNYWILPLVYGQFIHVVESLSNEYVNSDRQVARQELPIHLAKPVLCVSSFITTLSPLILYTSPVENGTVYDQTLILTPEFALNRTAFEIYGQPWQSASTVIFNLGLSLSIGATIVHMTLWHGKEMWENFMNAIKRAPIDDLHYAAMARFLLWSFTAFGVLNRNFQVSRGALHMVRRHHRRCVCNGYGVCIYGEFAVCVCFFCGR